MKKILITLFIMFFSFTSVSFAQTMTDIVTNFGPWSDGDYNWSGASKWFVPDPSGENLFYDKSHLEYGRLKIQVVASQRWGRISKLIVSNTSVKEDRFAVSVHVDYHDDPSTPGYYYLLAGQTAELPADRTIYRNEVRVVKHENIDLPVDPPPVDPPPVDPPPVDPPPEEPSIDVGESPTGGFEKTDGKFFHVPVNMPVIGQYASDLIKVASPYLWLFAVVFFGLIILAVLKRVFTR
ncbi:hypothetical protein [Brevibacillus daliensis]|uniref:hypothetical protein n=1 Tax=Brevibacillus daliensis TaxID=2892995 RepID=UPI001E3C61C2|nr:hypothetical protein [Brevibacillus daliensis]